MGGIRTAFCKIDFVHGLRRMDIGSEGQNTGGTGKKARKNGNKDAP
jgi:hypothetical protein